MKPRVTFDNYRGAALDDFHVDFACVWARDLSERTAFDLWLHVVDHASRIARGIRKQQPAVVVDDLADSIVWLLSFIAYCQSDKRMESESWLTFSHGPTQLLWDKYPNACPGCLDAWFVDL